MAFMGLTCSSGWRRRHSGNKTRKVSAIGLTPLRSPVIRMNSASSVHSRVPKVQQLNDTHAKHVSQNNLRLSSSVSNHVVAGELTE